MSRIKVVVCAGYSPSAQVVRKALRRVSEHKDIMVITPCPAGMGLVKFQDELNALDPNRTIVVEGCDGCCAMQALMLNGIMPSRTVIVNKTAVANEKSVAAAEAIILEALKEMGA
jgi:uncharacterized metal-binding protein